MPTARELLEQADALMRRNRAAGAAGTDDLPAAARLLVNSPVVPVTTSPALGGPSTLSPNTGASTLGLPTLPHTIGPPTQGFGPATTAPTLGPMTISPRSIQREPIAPSIAHTALPVDPEVAEVGADSTSAAETSTGAEEDIPLLTDSVQDYTEELPVLTEVIEEIEVDVTDRQASGEPSTWPPVPEQDAGVLGEIPAQPPEGRDPLGLDQPAPGYDPTPETLWAAKRAAAIYDGSAYEADSIAHALLEDGGPAGQPDDMPDAAPGAEAASAVPEASAPALLTLGEAQKREVAEEIRMQVLQRIDIFTDTGLRDQLGDRLKPLVDKASAELVEAINQHVGELLRAYVAEAIEREIESWRNRQG